MKRKKGKRHRGCAGKARYGSAQEAASVQPNQRVYLCEKCQCWHLTTK